MKDRIEDFISENRVEFDDLEPRPETWKGIQSALSNNEPKAEYSWLWKTAAMIFLCLSVILILERNLKNQTEELANNVLEEPTQINTELQEVESYYNDLILKKRHEIQFIIDVKKLTDIDLLKDLEQLDTMYLDLKDNLEKNQNDERLINAMIQNLQLRVEILNRQLKILEQISKHEEDEKISV